MSEVIQDKLRFVSHFAGRLRVRADTFRMLPDVGEGVAVELRGESGVASAVASPLTGSLLVTYEPAEVELPRLIAMIVRLGGLHGIELSLPDGWTLATSQGTRVREALSRANDKLTGRTRGAVDLRVAIPAVLASTGVAFFALGRRRIPEWYDLLFWSFVAFSNLNPHVTGQRREPSERDGGSD